MHHFPDSKKASVHSIILGVSFGAVIFHIGFLVNKYVSQSWQFQCFMCLFLSVGITSIHLNDT